MEETASTRSSSPPSDIDATEDNTKSDPPKPFDYLETIGFYLQRMAEMEPNDISAKIFEELSPNDQLHFLYAFR